MFDRYFSSSDSKIFITSIDGSKILRLDLCNGIGFRESSTISPVYSIGNLYPSFYSRGNNIVTGILDISMKYSEYMMKAISYVNSQDDTADKNLSPTSFENIVEMRDRRNASIDSQSVTSNQLPFSLRIELSVDENVEEVSIVNCRINGRGIEISSRNQALVVDGFTFIADRIK